MVSQDIDIVISIVVTQKTKNKHFPQWQEKSKSDNHRKYNAIDFELQISSHKTLSTK